MRTSMGPEGRSIETNGEELDAKATGENLEHKADQQPSSGGFFEGFWLSVCTSYGSVSAANWGCPPVPNVGTFGRVAQLEHLIQCTSHTFCIVLQLTGSMSAYQLIRSEDFKNTMRAR